MIGSKETNGGTKGVINKIRFMTGLDYETVLSQVPSNSKVTICTYDVYGDDSFFKRTLGHLQDCELIVNRIVPRDKEFFKCELPNVRVRVCEGEKGTHAKMILISPDTVYLSSQNFSMADWFQHAVCIQDKDVYNHYYKCLQEYVNKGITGNILGQKKDVYDISLFQTNGLGNYKPDLWGIEELNVDVILAKSVNWNQKFNNVRDRHIVICTQTLPNMDYVRTMISKLLGENNKICIIAHYDAGFRLEALKNEFPSIKTYIYNNFHAKMVLIEKDIVWLSSQNFGTSTWFENTIRIKNQKAYNYYVHKLEEFIGHGVWD